MPDEENIPTTDTDRATAGMWEFIPLPQLEPRQMTALEVQEQVRQLMRERELQQADPQADPAAPAEIKPHPDTVGIKLTAEVLLGRSLLDLLRAAPNNATVRTMLSKHCRKTIPVELTSVDEIIGWIESNITLPPPVVSEVPPNPLLRRAHQLAGVAVTAEDTVLTLEAYRRGTESGSCTYTSSWAEDRNARLNRLEFEEFVRNAGSFDELIDALTEYANQECMECAERRRTDIDIDEYDGENEECTDSGICHADRVHDTVVQLLIGMRDRIEDREARCDFEERFGL